MSSQRTWTSALVVATLVLASWTPALAQPPATPAQSGRGGPQAPQFVSPEVSAERRIAFRIHAPQADAIRLTASDIPGVGQATQLTKDEGGVWEVSVGPVPPGCTPPSP